MDDNTKLPKPLESDEVMRNVLVISALQSADKVIELGLREDQICISCKVSQVQDLIAVNSDLAGKCQFPLHLGIIEAGMGVKGIVASTAGIANLIEMVVGGYNYS